MLRQRQNNKQPGTAEHLTRELLALALFVLIEKANHWIWESYGPAGPPTPMAVGLWILVAGSLLILTGSLLGHAADLLEQTRKLWVSFRQLIGTDGDEEGKGGGMNVDPTPLPTPPGGVETAEEDVEAPGMPSRRAAGLIAAGLTIGLVLGRASQPGRRHDT